MPLIDRIPDRRSQQAEVDIVAGAGKAPATTWKRTADGLHTRLA